MGACQPFLSGAISKTCNPPETATIEEIADIYMAGWRLGLKALAVYHDNCKVGQPLSDAKSKDQAVEIETPAEPEVKVVEVNCPEGSVSRGSVRVRRRRSPSAAPRAR